MTTLTTQGNYSNNTDLLYRDWVGRVISMLTAVGLVRTGDTGQIDVATALRPTTTATVGGYAVFAFADEGQAARPIFLRVEFGSSVAQASNPSLRVVVCKGTDGAGGPVGILWDSGRWDAGGTGTGVGDWRASGGVGYVALCPMATPFGGGARTGQPFFLIERSPDSTSVLIVAQEGGGSSLATISGGVAPGCAVVTYDTGVATSGIVPVVVPYLIAGSVLAGGTALAAASLGPVFPWVLFPPSQAPWQSRLGLSFPGGDAPGAPFQVTLEGEERTYLPIPLSDAYSNFGISPNPKLLSANSRHIGLAIRWE